MRRSASEIIRNLEMRIARLERQADNGPSMVLTRSVVNELDKGAETDWLSAKIGSTKACKGGYCYYVSDEGGLSMPSFLKMFVATKTSSFKVMMMFVMKCLIV